MMNRLTRHLFSITLVILLSALSWLIYADLRVVLHDSRFISGWTLLALIAVLTLFSLRKRLSFLPLGSARNWLRVHVYGSALTLVLFVIHSDLRWPGGGLESLLLLLFSVVFLSGLIGLWLSRRLPERLTTRSDSVLFERLPLLRRELAESVEQLVLQSVENTGSTLIPGLYRSHLQEYFARPRHFLHHIRESERPRQALLSRIDDLHRYANPDDQAILHRLSRKVIDKSHLDYQYALQWLLKGWLFVHIPATYSLLLTIALHVFIGYEFRGD